MGVQKDKRAKRRISNVVHKKCKNNIKRQRQKIDESTTSLKFKNTNRVL